VNEICLKYYGTEKNNFTTLAIHRQGIVIIIPKSAQIRIWIVVYQTLRRVHWHYLLLFFFSCVLVRRLLRLFGAKRDKTKSMAPISKNVEDMSATLLKHATEFPYQYQIITPETASVIVLNIQPLFMCNFEGLLPDAVTNPHLDTNTFTLQQLEESGLSIFTENCNLLDTFNEKESVECLGGKLSFEFNAKFIITHMKKCKNVPLICRKEKATWFFWCVTVAESFLSVTKRQGNISFPTGCQRGRFL
jgi:hypothetical protein